MIVAMRHPAEIMTVRILETVLLMGTNILKPILTVPDTK